MQGNGNTVKIRKTHGKSEAHDQVRGCNKSLKRNDRKKNRRLERSALEF